VPARRGAWEGSGGAHHDPVPGTEAEMPRTSKSLMSPTGVLGGPGPGSSTGQDGSGVGLPRLSPSRVPQEGTTALYRLQGKREQGGGSMGGPVPGDDAVGARGSSGRAGPPPLLPTQLCA